MASEDDIRPVDPPAALRALDDVVAPDRLRLAIAEQVARAEGRRRRYRWPMRLATAVALPLAIVLVLAIAEQQVIDSPGDGRGSALSVRAVAPIALRTATAPAPAARPGGELLAAKAGPIAFPTWTRAGWRAVGARSDTIRGHDVTTVFYADGAGRRIGYAIADARLPAGGGELVTRRGARLRVLARGATSIVTWRRAGRTCILAGRGIRVERLLTLASYAA